MRYQVLERICKLKKFVRAGLHLQHLRNANLEKNCCSAKDKRRMNRPFVFLVIKRTKEKTEDALSAAGYSPRI
jgi:hypothetical protein